MSAPATQEAMCVLSGFSGFHLSEPRRAAIFHHGIDAIELRKISRILAGTSPIRRLRTTPDNHTPNRVSARKTPRIVERFANPAGKWLAVRSARDCNWSVNGDPTAHAQTLRIPAARPPGTGSDPNRSTLRRDRRNLRSCFPKGARVRGDWSVPTRSGASVSRDLCGSSDAPLQLVVELKSDRLLGLDHIVGTELCGFHAL